MKQRHYRTVAELVVKGAQPGPATKPAERVLRRGSAKQKERRVLRTYLWSWLDEHIKLMNTAPAEDRA